MYSPSNIERLKSESAKNIKPDLIEKQQKQNQLCRKLNFHEVSQGGHIKSQKSYAAGLQRLLKVSPYGKLLKQRSFQQIQIQESFLQHYQSGYTPTSQHLNQFFTKDFKSLNSTNSSSVKQRIQKTMKLGMSKKSSDSSNQILSSREQDKKIIKALQTLLARSSNILESYKTELEKYEKENQKLKELLQSKN